MSTEVENKHIRDAQTESLDNVIKEAYKVVGKPVVIEPNDILEFKPENEEEPFVRRVQSMSSDGKPQVMFKSGLFDVDAEIIISIIKGRNDVV